MNQALWHSLAFYHPYCTLELRCRFAQIGNSEPLAALTRDLERFR